jgi:hypothetical protein
MPAWIGPTQKAVINPEFVCGAIIRPSISMRLPASESTPQLTICIVHIPLLALFDVSLQRSASSGAEGIASPFSLRTDDGRYWL